MPSATDTEIRPITPEFGRWEELLGLIRTAFAYMDGRINPPSSAHLLTADGLREKSAAENGIVAVSNGRLAGCVFLAERADHFYLGKLAVAPEFRGFGIGRTLVRHAENVARAAGKPAIELQARIELTENHATFSRLGYREVARTAHPGFDRSTSITMRRELA